MPNVVVPTYYAQTEEALASTQIAVQMTQIAIGTASAEEALKNQLQQTPTNSSSGSTPYYGSFDDDGFNLFCIGIKDIVKSGNVPYAMKKAVIEDPIDVSNGSIAFITVNGKTNMSLTHQWGSTKAFVGVDFFYSNNPSEDEMVVFGGMIGSMLGYCDPSISGERLEQYLAQITEAQKSEKDVEIQHGRISFGLKNQFAKTGPLVGWSFWVDTH